jgi:phosphoglycerol transferase MdoB-like AlkP superfamily enzyme
MNRVALLAARALFSGFWLATAAYCLVAFVPFTYVEVIQFEIVPTLTAFARWHPFLFWIALGAVAFSLREDVRRPATRLLTIGFLAVSVATGAALAFRPLLATLPNDASSLRYAFVALLPLGWVAVIDLAGCAGRIRWAPPAAGEDGRLFRASLMSAGLLALVYLGIFLVRFAGDTSTGLTGGDVVSGAVFSLASHLVVFAGAFAVLSLIRALASVAAIPSRAELVFTIVAAIAGVTAALRDLVLGAVSLTGHPEVAIAFATAIVVAHAGLACRFWASSGRSAPSGIELFFAPLAPGRDSLRIVQGLGLAVLAAAAFALASATSVMDWNFLGQKLSAVLIWVLIFAAFLAIVPRIPARPRPTAWYLGLAVVVLCAFKGLSATTGADLSKSLDRYAGRDPSYKFVRDLLTRPRGAATRDDAAFYRYLQEKTNIPRSVHIEPKDVRFVPTLSASPGPKPNVFLFVLDSLRPDYLSPYNPAVTFTPAIEAFARDSVVFTNAFTRYGGTGLSQPSIWVGGMIPHQQYMTPFDPLNALQKLVEADDYRSFVSIDTVLRLILTPTGKTVEIDRGVLTHDLRLKASLADLAARLRKGEAQNRPVFAYVQPQDVHISTISREGASVPAGESYPGFYAPYASRLARADAGFGEFLAALRELGMYDDSIIILTSDHGDSLGEDGRWGHAYTIFPEVLKIPLIVHLPASLKNRVASNPAGLAFLTDITPTLYWLLGHEPELRNDIFGRSLFAARPRDLPAAQRAEGKFLVASSYGPVYGILGENGRSLYIADSVNYAEYFYDLPGDPNAPPPALSDEQRAAYRELIRASIDAIHTYYNVPDTSAGR